ncbi:threonine/serine exporter, partial [Streptococcus hyovaginalis]
DSFKGDYGEGVAKIVEALTIAASLGVGVDLGLFIAKGVFLLWQ